MTDFHSEYSTCMELIKQKSKEVSETDILLKAMKDLLNKLEEEEKKAEAFKKRKRSARALDLLSYIAVVVVPVYFNDN